MWSLHVRQLLILCLVSVLGLGLYWYLRPTQVAGIEQAAQSADSALPPLASPAQPHTQRSGSAEAPRVVPAHPQVGIPSLSLRVVSRFSSMAIANARVEEVGPAESAVPARSAVTDSDGRCTFVRPTSSLATPCSVAVSAAGFATKELQLPSTPGTQTPAPQDVLIELQPEGLIAGSVVWVLDDYLATLSDDGYNFGQPYLGIGGISSVDDALERLDAGAALLQIYTGLIYQGPGLVREIHRALAARAKSV